MSVSCIITNFSVVQHWGEDHAQPRVLLVEDDRTALMVLEAQVTGLGYRVETASNGADALTMLRNNPHLADIVITDRMMPVMDGLALTRRLKREPETKHIPVVILTGAKETQDISDGITAGAFYYLTKPVEEKLVASVLASAYAEIVRDRQIKTTIGGHQAAFNNLQFMRFKLRLPEEVEAVSSMLASMHEYPEQAIHGIYELLQNAVEHGVMRFGMKAKSDLLQEGTWNEALHKRSHDQAYAKGWVEATGLRKQENVIIIIKDNGPGFDWRKHIKADFSRSSATCGRGIMRAASSCFNKLSYNQAGNVAIGILASATKVNW